MDIALLRTMVSHLNRKAFASFVLHQLQANKDHDRVNALSDLGEGIFCRQLLGLYGYSIHDVYVLHHAPLEVFKPSARVRIVDPDLMGRLSGIKRAYHRLKGAWGMVSPALVKDDALHALDFISNLSGLLQRAGT